MRFVPELLLLALAGPAIAQDAPPPRIVAVEARDDQLTLAFDQPMVTWGTATVVPGLRLAPAVDCRWGWEDDTRLACEVPLREGEETWLPKATAFRLDVAAGLWSQAGAPLPPQRLTAESKRPTAVLVDSDWTDGRPSLRIDSDFRLREEALRAVLRLRVDGEAVAYRFEDETETWDSGISWRLLPDWPDGARTLEVELLPGLRAPDGPLPGLVTWTKRFRLDEPFAFAGHACELWDRDPGRDEADACDAFTPGFLLFTAAPDAASLARLGASLPEGLALGEAAGYCYRCKREGRAPLHAIALTLSTNTRVFDWQPPTDLRDTRGRPMAPATPVRIALADFPATLKASPSAVVVRPGTATFPDMHARNLDWTGAWVDVAIGRQVRRGRDRITIGGPRNVEHALALPSPPRTVARDGGLLVSGVAGLPDSTRTVGFAPFHAIARRGPVRPGESEALVAWATEWADAAPVAGLQAEWLLVSPEGRTTLRARAAAGDDGVVALSADALPDTQREWLQVLRLQAGRRTVVLPLHAVARQDVGQADRWRQVARDLQFGVTDRLLYRPGETVKYRLWLRRRDDAVLSTPAPGTELPMRLAMPYWSELPVTTWTGRSDAWGSVSGEQRLPSTLADGRYCVASAGTQETHDYGEPDGACFDVARFDAQALWAGLATPRRVLRAGETLEMAAEGGFYSGGAAAGLPLSWMGLALPARVDEAFPDFSAFTFVAPDEGAESDPLRDVALPRVLDGRGRAVLRMAVPAPRNDDGDAGDPPMPFARVQVNAIIGLDGQARASSPTATVYVAAHARYVGLRTTGDWRPDDAGPALEAVVVGHDGVAVPGVPVSVAIHDGDGDAVLARCTLSAGEPAGCPFRAPGPGRYRLEASAEGAAGTTLSTWVWGAGGDPREDVAQARLEAMPGDPGRVRLRQPHARARVLLLVEREAVRAHRLLEVGPEAVLELPPDPRADGAPVIAVRVLVRPVLDDADAGFAAATLDAELRLPREAAPPSPPRLSTARDTLAPGETLVVELGNDAAVPRAFTVTVVDDGMHQQAADLHPGQDPAGAAFLGELATWRNASWYAMEGWEHGIHGNLVGLDVADLARRGAVAPPAPPANYAADAASLDSIEVTGSRMLRADVFETRLGGGRRSILPATNGAPLPRVRTRFADTAYWNDALVLAPGETRTLEIPLPDNLTRWRVQAWATGTGGDFARAERTVTATLPVEVRLGLPTHLYPGDRSHGAVNARLAGGSARTLAVAGQAQGAGVASEVRREVRVEPQAGLSAALPLAPDADGGVAVLGEGQAGADRDAVAGEVPVLSRWATGRVSQLAWLTGGALDLRSPVLPAGAEDARLAVAVGDGLDALRREWLDGLRDYPHRCWEQTLSRSLGAALALADPRDAARWPEAARVIEDAYAAAPAFVDGDGHFRFFDSAFAAPGESMLSAHTLRGFLLLESLGHPPPATLRRELPGALRDGLEALEDRADDEGRLRGHDREVRVLVLAALSAAGETVPDEHVAAAWSDWEALGWHARAELAELLSRQPAMSDVAAQALDRLRDAGTARGVRRVLEDPRDTSALMGSGRRDQCAVAATLLRLDPVSRRDGRAHALLRGIVDQYAGGAPTLDTQAALHCLLAVREAGAAAPDAAAAIAGVVLQAGGRPLPLAPLPSGEGGGQGWSGALPAGSLRVEAAEGLPALAMLRADATYRQDQATVQAGGTGMVLDRRHTVLRDGRWQDGVAPREGEWVRVVLRLQVPAWRNFVAITDPVPGGWTPRDTTLAGVGGAALAGAGADDSPWFDARQTGTTHVRLYARRLPPGTHEVSYLAQATHAGEFLAPPAVAELMYGSGSRANTGAGRVRVLPAR